MFGDLKKRLADRDLLIGVSIMESRVPSTVEILAKTGFDFVVIDREHSGFNMETVTDMIARARLSGISPHVRIRDYGYHESCPVLDQGAEGIIIPRVRCELEVKQVLGHIKYPPIGMRGMAASGTPLSFFGITQVESAREFADRAMEGTVVTVQIETREALENLESILSLEGVDIAHVGPDDLTFNLGIPGEKEHPMYLDAVRRVIELSGKHGVTPGIAVGDPLTAIHWIDAGMRVIWYSSDVALMAQAASEALQRIRRQG